MHIFDSWRRFLVLSSSFSSLYVCVYIWAVVPTSSELLVGEETETQRTRNY